MTHTASAVFIRPISTVIGTVTHPRFRDTAMVGTFKLIRRTELICTENIKND